MGPASAGNSGVSNIHATLLEVFVMSNPKFNELGSSKWITQREAALLRKVSPAAISFLLRKGRLRSKIISGRRLVRREDVLNFKPLIRGVGRPSKYAIEASSAEIDRKEWITQKEAADLRRTAPDVIRAAIKRKRMRTLRKDGVLYVCKKDVLNYRPRVDYRPGDVREIPIPPGEDPKDWISVEKAAQIRDVTEAAILMQVSRKRIRSIKWGDTRLVHRQDILNFKRKPRTQRPKKNK